jgi:hypothetical protein
MTQPVQINWKFKFNNQFLKCHGYIYRSCTCIYTQEILFLCCIVTCCNENSFFVLKIFLYQKHAKYHILLPLPYWFTTHFFTVNMCVYVYVNKSLCYFSSGMSLGLVDCIVYRTADITYLHKYQNYAFSVLVDSFSLNTKCYWTGFQITMIDTNYHV